MNDILVYTFRTNKHLPVFKDAGIDIFIFSNLKKDLSNFQKLIKKLKPKNIVGFAEVKTRSRFETRAVNSFGQNGKVSRDGKDSYSLYVPQINIFPKSTAPTNSFCNWTMYKISEIVEYQSVNNFFIHFNQKDLDKMVNFIKNIK